MAKISEANRKKMVKHLKEILKILDKYPSDENIRKARIKANELEKMIQEGEEYASQREAIARLKSVMETSSVPVTLRTAMGYLPEEMLLNVHSSSRIFLENTKCFQRISCKEAKEKLSALEKSFVVHMVNIDGDYIGGNPDRPVVILEVG